MGFLKKLVNKIANKVSNNLADKAANKIVGNVTDNYQQSEAVSQSYVSESDKQVAALSEQQALLQQQALAMQMTAMQATANTADANSIAQANEILKYFVFDKDMNLVGIKDDAPDYLKEAYEKQLKEQQK